MLEGRGTCAQDRSHFYFHHSGQVLVYRRPTPEDNPVKEVQRGILNYQFGSVSTLYYGENIGIKGERHEPNSPRTFPCSHPPPSSTMKFTSGLLALAVALASTESALAWFRVACTGPLVSGMTNTGPFLYSTSK